MPHDQIHEAKQSDHAMPDAAAQTTIVDERHKKIEPAASDDAQQPSADLP